MIICAALYTYKWYNSYESLIIYYDFDINTCFICFLYLSIFHIISFFLIKNILTIKSNNNQDISNNYINTIT